MCMPSLKVSYETALPPEIFRTSRISRIFYACEKDDMGRFFFLFQKGVLLLFPQ